MTKKKFKPTFPQLALLDWLFEKDRLRFFTHTSHMESATRTWLYEVAGQDEDGKKKLSRVYPSHHSDGSDVRILERLGGRDSIQTHTLYQQKFIRQLTPTGDRERFEKFMEQFADRRWHWAEHIYLVTDTAREWWKAEGKALYQAAAAEREAERSATARMVVLGAMAAVRPEISSELRSRLPEGIPLPIPARRAVRPQSTAIVVRETETRLYVSDVTPLRTGIYTERNVIEGRPPNEYVAKEHVMADHASPQMARRILEIDADYAEDLNRIAEQAVEAMLPALLELSSRLAQKDAERAFFMQEAIGSAPETPKP